MTPSQTIHGVRNLHVSHLRAASKAAGRYLLVEKTMRSQFRFGYFRSTMIAVAYLAATAGAAIGQAQRQAAVTTTQPPQALQTQRPSIPPPQYIPPHDYDQRNIKLDLHFDWEHEQAIGTAAITLVPLTKDLRRVDFDAAFMTI